ncbi:MAG: hypothetical protein R3F14_00020 [Polyangiaceae bacterium]
MSKYWILDKVDTPQGFPLLKLIENIRKVLRTADIRACICRSQGFGLTVNGWDELLSHVDEVPISLADLERIAGGVDEWFYDLDVVCVAPTATIRFGVHDSTALFVDAAPEIGEHVVLGFQRVDTE